MSKKYTRQDKSQPKHYHYSSAAPITRSTTIVAANPCSRPEWRGTGLHKPAKKATQPKDGAVSSKAQREKELLIESGVDPVLQQKLLDVLRGAFPDTSMRGYEELRPVLTAVKASLDAGIQRDNERGVWDADMREAFALRWGAERALLLSALLVMWGQEKFKEELVFEKLRKGVNPLYVVCFGTGLAETLALAALLRQERFDGESVPNDKSSGKAAPVTLHIVQRSTEWTAEIETLHRALRTAPVLSKYASAAAKAAARSFLGEDSLAYLLHSCNVPEDLDSVDELKSLMREGPGLIMLCFSLREMQRSSVPKTVKFLMALTKEAAKNTLLLIVDQVEDTHDCPIGFGEKTYPLHFLLDFALLGRGVSEEKEKSVDEAESNEEEAGPEAAWERLARDEERMLKIDQGLQYPLSLGKVAAQIHVFKRR